MILRAHAHFWPFSKSICLLILCKDNHLQLVVFDSPEGGGVGGGGLLQSFNSVTSKSDRDDQRIFGFEIFHSGNLFGWKIGQVFFGSLV